MLFLDLATWKYIAKSPLSGAFFSSFEAHVLIFGVRGRTVKQVSLRAQMGEHLSSEAMNMILYQVEVSFYMTVFDLCAPPYTSNLQPELGP